MARGFLRSFEVGIVPIQILESKLLSSNDNIFLRNLRSRLSANDMLNTLQTYQKYNLLDNKNVYLDRLVRANLAVFEEALAMTETVNEIFLEIAEKNGWLDKWLDDKFIDRKEIAKRLLQLGDSIEKVADATELPIETVASLL